MTEEEYFRKNYPESCYGDKPLSPHWDFFQDGVEFGYNKANKWHYVKDEKDLPTDKKEYLLLLGSNIKTFGSYNGRFWESWKGDFSWQEVQAYFFVPVPEFPKEIE